MSDELDLDAALDAYNAYVEISQQQSQAQTARRLADECGVTLAEAYVALQSCRWSATRARRLLLEATCAPQG